jgi:DNA polymerase
MPLKTLSAGCARMPEPGRESRLFLQALAESGLDYLYAEPAPAAPQQAAAPGAQPAIAREGMLELRSQALACTRCSELASTRTSVVFGAGNIKARLVFVGEAPGREEDEQGLPFVGEAGQLLTKIIESIGLSRRDVFICNVLKCRPPANRQPAPEEVLNCSPFLKAQIRLIRPQIICALGNFAARALLNTAAGVSKLRGRFHDYEGIKLICTFHPAYLLRNPSEKGKVWTDMKTIKRELECPTNS